MRRIASRQLFPRLATMRTVYTIWGTTVHESNDLVSKVFSAPQDPTMISRLFNTTGLKCFQLDHVPAQTPTDVSMSNQEQYLYSAICNDTSRLLAVDWTADFDSFWVDAVKAHRWTFDKMFCGKAGPIAGIFLGDRAGNVAAKGVIEKKLVYLESVLKWAEEAEKVYSGIANARFDMQRGCMNALERERTLAGCVEAVQQFENQVPAEFRRKAMSDIECHLDNMRHWVWDCPNAKMYYPRKLA